MMSNIKSDDLVLDIHKYLLTEPLNREHGFTNTQNSVLRIYTNNTITEVN